MLVTDKAHWPWGRKGGDSIEIQMQPDHPAQSLHISERQVLPGELQLSGSPLRNRGDQGKDFTWPFANCHECQAEQTLPRQLFAKLPCCEGRARSAFLGVHAHMPVVWVNVLMTGYRSMLRCDCPQLPVPSLSQKPAGCSSWCLHISPALAQGQQPLAEGYGGDLRTLNPRIDRGFLEPS